MDDFKIIIWIIIGVIYLLSRGKKKEAPPPPRRSRPVEDAEPDESSRPVPKSFEELLREIEGMKQPRRPEPKPEPEPELVDYDEQVGNEERDLEDVTPSYKRNDQEAYKIYEEAKSQAFNRKSLEETVKLEDTIVRFTTFKGYEKEPRKSVVHDYLKELRDPQGFKKAFIMSEILRPKY